MPSRIRQPIGLFEPTGVSPIKVSLRVGCIMLLILLAGCVNAFSTRFPTAYTASPYAENMAYQQTNPFPDPNIGPSMDSTPREYNRPRTEPRRAAEQRLMQGIPIGPEYVPPGPPRSGLQRPQAVY
ncbi:MAG: hypothetical protein KDA91_13950 [Planctomycetaceae bacterium]|nr:hypothetical protein [Planctomycetaceae bacterium]